ncbi:MAG: ribosomal L7Ae/L30e/S12e/Gadd45 family protein [Bacillota bacterium]|nr:ribosomal L7Ae/L30e/S12e/Gadd45 family protein [Bacillota bacterium]
MLEKLQSSGRLVGLKQSKKAVREGLAEHAFIAEDAEERVKRPFIELCAENGIAYTTVETMQKLGEACKIDVPTAAAVILKQ